MLEVERLSKTFVTERGDVQAVREVSFKVEKGEFFTLLGPSGCGKTTTLRCVAGLQNPDSGEIMIGGQPVYSTRRGSMVPAHRRDIGMVFQSYAIWPHMTVYENVAFPLVHGRRKYARADVKERVRKALSLVQLENLEDRPAPLLSGGQQQRVALARALVYEPQLLLLDEPLSNLDAKLRIEMRVELKELVERLNLTTLYVTHDQEEALVLSNRIAVMSGGQIMQEGDPKEVYLRPRNAFAAGFVGKGNFFSGQVIGQDGAAPGKGLVETPIGKLNCPLGVEAKTGDKVVVTFRPEAVVLYQDQRMAPADSLLGVVERILFTGDRLECTLQVGEGQVHSEASPFESLSQGEQVWVHVPAERIWMLKEAGTVEEAVVAQTAA